MTLDELYTLPLYAFCDFVKTIRYGYRDVKGGLHFADEANFTVKDYHFSLPEQVRSNRCGWCWDVANLIFSYAAKRGLPCTNLFMEYQKDGFHQTHTQCFVQWEGLWYAFPDNTSPEKWGEIFGYACKQEALQAFSADFEAYLRFLRKESYDPSAFHIYEFHVPVLHEMSDEEYMAMARGESAT